MKAKKANQQLVNEVKALVRATATSLRRSGQVLMRTRFCTNAEEAHELLVQETKNTEFTGITYYSVEENRRLHDTGRVTLRYAGVNGHTDKDVQKTVSAALRERGLEVKSVETGLRILGLKETAPQKNTKKKNKNTADAPAEEKEAVTA